MKIEEIVKTMMQGGFDSAMGGHYDKTEEENKKHQEKVYDMVVSGGVKSIQSLLNEQLDEVIGVIEKEAYDDPKAKLIRETKHMATKESSLELMRTIKINYLTLITKLDELREEDK